MVEDFKQRGVEDVCEHQRQLVSTVLQGRWRDGLRSCCFAGDITVVWGKGASEVSSWGEAQAPAVVGEVELMGWSWWMKSRGMVSELSHCLSKRQ